MSVEPPQTPNESDAALQAANDELLHCKDLIAQLVTSQRRAAAELRRITSYASALQSEQLELQAELALSRAKLRTVATFITESCPELAWLHPVLGDLDAMGMPKEPLVPPEGVVDEEGNLEPTNSDGARGRASRRSKDDLDRALQLRLTELEVMARDLAHTRKDLRRHKGTMVTVTQLNVAVGNPAAQAGGKLGLPIAHNTGGKAPGGRTPQPTQLTGGNRSQPMSLDGPGSVHQPPLSSPKAIGGLMQARAVLRAVAVSSQSSSAAQTALVPPQSRKKPNSKAAHPATTVPPFSLTGDLNPAEHAVSSADPLLDSFSVPYAQKHTTPGKHPLDADDREPSHEDPPLFLDYVYPLHATDHSMTTPSLVNMSAISEIMPLPQNWYHYEANLRAKRQADALGVTHETVVSYFVEDVCTLVKAARDEFLHVAALCSDAIARQDGAPPSAGDANQDDPDEASTSVTTVSLAHAACTHLATIQATINHLQGRSARDPPLTGAPPGDAAAGSQGRLDALEVAADAVSIDDAASSSFDDEHLSAVSGELTSTFATLKMTWEVMLGVMRQINTHIFDLRGQLAAQAAKKRTEAAGRHPPTLSAPAGSLPAATKTLTNGGSNGGPGVTHPPAGASAPKPPAAAAPTKKAPVSVRKSASEIEV